MEKLKKEENESNKLEKTIEFERFIEIDYFRGFTIILMVFVNFIASASSTPAWLKHAKDIGLTITDLIAPAFIFAIGLTYKYSFDKRAKKDGIKKAYSHFVTRFLAIIGIGAFFTAGASIVSPNEAKGSWGVLQAIGGAGLITLIFIRWKMLIRLAIGFFLLLLYQLILDKYAINIVLSSEHGGLIGTVSWSALLILSTFLAELFNENRDKKYLYLLVSFIFFLIGVFSSKIFPISKHRISFSYILISLSASSFVFFTFYLIKMIFKIKLNFLIWWGQNPLFLYILHMILLGVTFIPGNKYLFLTKPFPFILFEFSIFFLILSFTAFFLYRKKIYIKI